jgi:hypothetical protein
VAPASTRAANDSGDDLWTVPPEKFVAARNALKDAELRKLKRPTPSAWLVNMLVRRQPKEIEALFRAGDALHTAQGRVLAGASPSELHDAMRAVRDAVSAAMKRARAILTEHGRKPTPDLTRRVTHTLRSAAIDRRVREVVEQAQLTADPTTDDVEALSDVRVPKHVKQAKPKAKPQVKPVAPKRDVRAEQRARAEERARLKAEQARAKAERAAAAREARERLRVEAVQSAAALDAAKREVARLERELKAARTTLTRARDTHTRAKKRATRR